MGFYSAIKKNEILSFTGKWIEVENIILSEVSQVQKVLGQMFSLICERSNTKTNITIQAYKYIQNMFPKAGLLREEEKRK
jgi:hypothetical protein